MEIQELFELARQGEGPHTEFKIKLPEQLHKIAKTFTAFANCGGGTVLVGIDDSGRLTGVQDPDGIVRTMAQLARKCSPALQPYLGAIEITKGRYVVYAVVPETKPCTYDGVVYVRVGSCSVAAGGEEIRQLLGLDYSTLSSSCHLPASFFLPPPSKGFRGRAQELEKLVSLLRCENKSVVVIEGIGGIGKTALSTHFANNIENEGYLPLWVECREDTSFDVVVSALANFARFHGNVTLSNQLDDAFKSTDDCIGVAASGLAKCKYTLFFDDYHYVIDNNVNRLIQGIAKRAVSCKVVLISRRRPDLIRGMSLIRLSEVELVDGLDRDACREFMIDRGLTDVDKYADEVWRITGEGHPKAVEIFIARSKSMSVSRLLATLPVFKAELSSAWLAPLMDELPSDQRNMAVDLSVFERPLPFDAIDQLYPDVNNDSFIKGLFDRFVLDRSESNLFRMHPLIREHCYPLIGDHHATHLWAAQYFASQLPRDVHDDVVDSEQIELGKAAWLHFVKAGEHERAAETLDLLRAPLMTRGHYEQLMLLIDRTQLPPEKESWYRIHKAKIFSLWGNTKEVIPLIKDLVDSENDVLSREAVLVLATHYNDHGMPASAKALLEQHRERILQRAHTLVRRRYLSRLVEAYSLLGELDLALECASKVFDACNTERDEINGALSLRQMASVLFYQKKYSTALSLAQLSHSMLIKRNRTRDAAISQQLMAKIQKELGDYEQALSCLHEALQAFMQMADRENAAKCRKIAAELSSSYVCPS